MSTHRESGTAIDYAGTELNVFAHALNWKKYYAGVIRPYVKGRVLEVGAGLGWPGVFLAEKSGCDVSLTDFPIEGLGVAKERGPLDQLSGICTVAIASGSAFPF